MGVSLGEDRVSLGEDRLMDPYPHLQHDLETDTMITQAGYVAETHKVKTPDGYWLTIHRIVGEGPVVFMQHGLEDASSAWVLAGPKHGGPAFRLAEQGYDVWLGNFRGNHYSREHETLDPDTDNSFWKFSWDEMVKYDLPTMLNHVMEVTHQKKIYYIGHSMGTTTYMAMNSMDPSWADRVELAGFLAPVAYVDHMKSPIRLIAPLANQIQWIANHMGIGEFLPSNWLMDWIADHVCGNNHLDIICTNIIFLLTGYDKPQMNETMVPTIASHTPSGTSTYTVLQYAQEVKHKRFGGLDWGDNDWLAAEADLFKILSQVQHVVHSYQVPWHGWNHLDFLYALDIDKLQNNHLVELLAAYPITSKTTNSSYT